MTVSTAHSLWACNPPAWVAVTPLQHRTGVALGDNLGLCVRCAAQLDTSAATPSCACAYVPVVTVVVDCFPEGLRPIAGGGWHHGRLDGRLRAVNGPQARHDPSVRQPAYCRGERRYHGGCPGPSACAVCLCVCTAAACRSGSSNCCSSISCLLLLFVSLLASEARALELLPPATLHSCAVRARLAATAQ